MRNNKEIKHKLTNDTPTEETKLDAVKEDKRKDSSTWLMKMTRTYTIDSYSRY